MHQTTDQTFRADVLEADLPVLVDFWAPWCGPCRAVAPVLEQLQDELTGRLKIVKVNVDENNEIAGALGVRSIPTLVVFKEGKAVEGAVGALSKQQMLELLQPHLEPRSVPGARFLETRQLLHGKTALDSAARPRTDVCVHEQIGGDGRGSRHGARILAATPCSVKKIRA